MDLSLALRNAEQRHGPTLGITLPPDCLAYGKDKPCFFIESPSRIQARADGKYSHVKIYKDTFFDYINNTTYPTFQEWVSIIPGASYDEIRFGFQRWDGRNTAISFNELMAQIEVPVRRIPPPLPLSDDDDLDQDLVKLIRKMNDHGLGINDVEVRAFMPAKMFLDEYT
jgi:hypothetical protein